jgi:hypothetical protein
MYKKEVVMKKIIPIAIAGLLLASCGDMTQSVETTVVSVTTFPPEVNLEVIDEMNLEIIKEMFPKEYELYGRQSILDLGNMVCNSVDYGMTVDGIAELSIQYGVDSGFLGGVYGVWVPSHCPENEAKFLNEPQSSTSVSA